MCTAVYFLPENTAVHHILKCYMHGSLVFTKDTAVADGNDPIPEYKVPLS